MSEQTLSVPEAGKALGISRQTAYELARRDEFPLPVLRVGKKLRVSTIALARLLGAEDAQIDAEPGAALIEEKPD